MQVHSSSVSPAVAMSAKRPHSKPPNPTQGPPLSDTEAKLTCANVRSLLASLRVVEDPLVASWLLSNARHTFHHNAAIPPRAFDTSVAVNAQQRVNAQGFPQDTPSACADGDAQAGKDLLLVPVTVVGTKLLGYSFGGASENTFDLDVCPYGCPSNAFLPHHVGRFCFDVRYNDLLIVAHHITTRCTGVISIRGGTQRERSLYIIPPGQYDKTHLPQRVLSMTNGVETRISSNPKYQFAVGAQGSGEWKWVIEALARLERMLKGRFTCTNMRRDDMHEQSGEVMNRRTGSMEADFDVKDAVGMRVFREMATRAYYSYMSAVSRANAAVNLSVASSTSAPSGEPSSSSGPSSDANQPHSGRTWYG